MIRNSLVGSSLEQQTTSLRCQCKGVYYVVEGLNSFGTSYYFFQLFFFMEKRFGFGNLENLALSALNGFLYMFAAYFGGIYGQRRGYRRALKIGLLGMVMTLGLGLWVESVSGQLGIMLLWTLGMCCTWPSLEALVSENTTPLQLQHSLGIYNLVWAGASALAYFVAGHLIQSLGFQSIFWFPMILHLVQLGILYGFERGWTKKLSPVQSAPETNRSSGGLNMVDEQVAELTPRPILRTRTFLKMAWMANPFAYVALNTVAAIMPGLVNNLSVPPGYLGAFCSIWFFTRMVAFGILWRWRGWHYRSGWFYGAFVGLLISFVGLCVANSIALAVIAQGIFGFCLGLIYYSSLYYSMDAGDAKGEHGGKHEAAIGFGIFLGPTVGAVASYLFPGNPQSVTWAVGVLLSLGLAGTLISGLPLLRKGRVESKNWNEA